MSSPIPSTEAMEAAFAAMADTADVAESTDRSSRELIAADDARQTVVNIARALAARTREVEAEATALRAEVERLEAEAGDVIALRDQNEELAVTQRDLRTRLAETEAALVGLREAVGAAVPLTPEETINCVPTVYAMPAAAWDRILAALTTSAPLGARVIEEAEERGYQRGYDEALKATTEADTQRAKEYAALREAIVTDQSRVIEEAERRGETAMATRVWLALGEEARAVVHDRLGGSATLEAAVALLIAEGGKHPAFGPTGKAVSLPSRKLQHRWDIDLDRPVKGASQVCLACGLMRQWDGTCWLYAELALAAPGHDFGAVQARECR